MANPCLLISIGLASLSLAAAASADEPPPRSAGLDCQVLEAIAPLEAGEGVDPSESAGAGPSAALPHVAKDLGLTDDEVAFVQARTRSAAKPYRPTCWGPLIPPSFGGLRERASFTRPIFITAEAAVVQMSRDQSDRGGSWICVVRRQGATWRAECQQVSWWAR